MWRVRYTETAQKDLQDIYDYIADKAIFLHIFTVFLT